VTDRDAMTVIDETVGWAMFPKRSTLALFG
jgi:hypothetical protein